jgi:beta-lactamase regulating signal transducer with metallopeptidase domain
MDMPALVHMFTPFSDRAADIAVTALWQGALVAAGLALCMRLAPRVSAAYRFAVWTTAFVALVGLSLFTLLPLFFTGAAGAMVAQVTENGARPWLSVDARWSVAIAALWLVASLFRGADLAIHSLRLRNLWKDAKPVSLDERVEGLLGAASGDSRRRRPIEVCTTATLQRPSVIGFFKPRILIPDWLFGRLTQGELEQIVLHEAEHLHRRDDWTNLAQKLCLVLFPLNPALVWIERRLCREREMACDDGVIRVTRAPRAYAACLTSLAERGLERRVEALSLGAWQRRPELVHRVHSILRSKGGLSPLGARVVLGTLGCGLLVGSIELARSPQLVAFVPDHSAEASNGTHQSMSKAAAEKPIQIASLHDRKLQSRGVREVPLIVSANGQMPVAANVAERESSVTQSAAVPVAITKQRDDRNVNEQSQQWIVLTEWQQVETRADDPGLRRDYDVDVASGQSADVPATPDPRQGSRITVTQLIFRVLPAPSEMPSSEGASGHAASKSTKKSAVSSPTSQPGVAMFREGWLVLQL